jgi:hypothetical protein
MSLFAAPWGLSLVIVMAALVSDVWRAAGALIASRIDENSTAFRYVKAVATALIAAIIAQLTLFPTGTMAGVPIGLRIGAMAAGFLAYLLARRSMVVGTLVCEVVLAGGVAWWG